MINSIRTVGMTSMFLVPLTTTNQLCIMESKYYSVFSSLNLDDLELSKISFHRSDASLNKDKVFSKKKKNKTKENKEKKATTAVSNATYFHQSTLFFISITFISILRLKSTQKQAQC